MCVIRAGIHKMLFRIASREDPDQTASLGLESQIVRIANWEDPGQTAFQKQYDLGLHFLSRPFLQATSV